MKLFKTFRLDTANHLLWCDGNRVPMAPKAFDVLAYLVEHAGRLVTQDDILEVRKTLGDRPDNPEFIETLPKRGYRFVAPVVEENAADPLVAATLPAIEEPAIEENTGPATAPPEQEGPSGK